MTTNMNHQEIETSTTTTTTTNPTTPAMTYENMSPDDQEALKNEYLWDMDMDIRKVKRLIDIGVPVGIQDEDSGYTKLHMLMYSMMGSAQWEKRRLNIIKYLIDDCNININIQNNSGDTALHYSLKNGRNLNVAKYLLYGWRTIDVQLQNDMGQNALHLLSSIYDKSTLCDCLEMIKYLVEHRRINIYAIDNEGKNALHYACKSGHIEYITYLINDCYMDNIHAQDNHGHNALHYAARGGNYDAVNYLLLINDGCIDVDVLDHHGYNALHYSMMWSNHLSDHMLNIVQCLIDNGNADITLTSRDGKNIMDILFENIHGFDIRTVVLLVTQLLGKYNDDVYNIAQHQSQTCLQEQQKYQNMSPNDRKNLEDYFLQSARHWNLKALKSCIDRGIPVGIQNSIGSNALHCVIGGYSSVNGESYEEECLRCIDCVKYLVHQCKIDVNIRNAHGRSPLHIAISNDSCGYRIMEYLLHECPMIKFHMTNNLGQNALHLLLSSEENTEFDIAHLDCYVDMIKYLISEHEIDIYASDNEGKTALIYACMNGHFDIVKYLIEECRLDNIHQQDNDGCNALHHAVCIDNYELVKYLINVGRSDINVLDNHGCNVLHYSVQWQREEIGLKIVQCLVDHGHADLTSTTNDGENIFDLAHKGKYGNIDMIVFLVLRLLSV